jgi:hypothetical protein
LSAVHRGEWYNPLGPDFSVLRCLGSLNTNYIIGRNVEIFKNSFFKDEKFATENREYSGISNFQHEIFELINYLTEAALVLCCICLHGQ